MGYNSNVCLFLMRQAVLLLLVGLVCQPAKVIADAAIEADTLAEFSTVLGSPVASGTLNDKIAKQMGQQGTTASRIIQLAKTVGIPLKLSHLTLDEIKNRGGVALLHLNQPEQYVALAEMGTHQDVIYQGKQIIVVDHNLLQDRYAGDALLLDVPSTSQSWLELENPVRVVKVTGPAEEVVERVRLRNRGHHVLDVDVDHTSCGCTSASLSDTKFAPGQAGLLTIRMQINGWGQKTESAVLRTNDPLWPSVQLGYFC